MFHLQTKFLKAEKNVNELKLSIDLTKRESKKLLERSALAEKEMLQGRSELMYVFLCTDFYLCLCFIKVYNHPLAYRMDKFPGM